MNKQTRLLIAKNKLKKGLSLTVEEKELLLDEGSKKEKELLLDESGKKVKQDVKRQPCKSGKTSDNTPPIYTVGLYKNGKRLVTTRLVRSKLPKFFRLMFLENQYKEQGDNRPDYIGYLVEGGNYLDAINIKKPYATLKASNPAYED